MTKLAPGLTSTQRGRTGAGAALAEALGDGSAGLGLSLQLRQPSGATRTSQAAGRETRRETTLSGGLEDLEG